jgi:hypothetical protein
MALLDRINVFWFGAGALLTTFGTNEIVAYQLSRVPRWLGGGWALGGAIFATLTGLAVIYGLGIREPIEEGDASPAPAPEPSAPDDLDAEA